MKRRRAPRKKPRNHYPLTSEDRLVSAMARNIREHEDERFLGELFAETFDGVFSDHKKLFRPFQK